MSPRYDLPKAAPEPLRRVQLFLNTVNHESGDDWLASWLAEHAPQADEGRARGLREALRALVLGNNGFAVAEEALRLLNGEAQRLRLELDGEGRPHLRGDDPLAEVLAVALAATLDGTFVRLKACRNCHWSFYDYSPNRSATWCSMQLCGNRKKTRTYRRRRASRAG